MWDHGTQPADAAEFAFWVLCWMKSPCLSHRWERTCAVENMRYRHDVGDVFAPLFLQVPHPGITPITLDDSLRRWTQEYGMQTMLLESPEVLICHVDRTANHASGQIDKLQFWLHADHVCHVPVLHATGAQVVTAYVPISMIAHLGDLTGGHYRAALRMTAAAAESALLTQNTVWALTDDATIPQPYSLPGLPEWFCRNAWCFWSAKMQLLPKELAVLQWLQRMYREKKMHEVPWEPKKSKLPPRRETPKDRAQPVLMDIESS
eukprot:s266_g23.t1